VIVIVRRAPARLALVACLVVLQQAPAARAATVNSHAAKSAADTAVVLPVHRSILIGEPGYVPPVDPDSDAVRTGRRQAPLVSMPFTNGAPSLEALVRRALARAGAGDRIALFRLCVSRDEFDRILWPEFPQSRPITGAKAGDGWYFLTRRNTGGADRMLDSFTGAKLKLVKVEYGLPVETYRNFRLHRGLTIVARDSTGAEVRIDDIRSIAERKGVFKIYSMRD
jgi:hypothetical protein